MPGATDDEAAVFPHKCLGPGIRLSISFLEKCVWVKLASNAKIANFIQINNVRSGHTKYNVHAYILLYNVSLGEICLVHLAASCCSCMLSGSAFYIMPA